MKVLTILILAFLIGFIPYHSGMNSTPIEIVYAPTNQVDILQKYTEFVISFEGKSMQWYKVAANKYDKGGENNMGLTFSSYNALCNKVLNTEPTRQHFYSLTEKDISLFIKEYYDAIDGDYFPKPIAYLMTETAWMSGVGGAKNKLIYTLIHKFEYYPKSYEDAVSYCNNNVCVSDLVPAFILERRQNLLWVCENDSTQSIFKNGWMRRVDSLECFINNNFTINGHNRNN